MPEQSGFRHGKNCKAHILYLTQRIEDSCEMHRKLGVAFANLTAAYDTVHHHLLLKILTKDHGLKIFTKDPY